MKCTPPDLSQPSAGKLQGCRQKAGLMNEGLHLSALGAGVKAHATLVPIWARYPLLGTLPSIYSFRFRE